MTKTRAYVTSVAAAALVAAALLYFVSPSATSNEAEAVFWLSGLGLLALLQVHTLPQGGGGSATFIAYLASTLVAPNWVAIAGAAVASSVSEVTNRRAPIKALFNVAQTVLALSAAVLVYRMLGGRSLYELGNATLLETSRESALPLLGLVLAYFSINSLAVSGAIAVSSDANVLTVWRQNTRSAVLYDLLSGPVVFLFAWIFVRVGPVGALGLTLPLLGARQLYKTNRQLEQVNEDLLQLMVKAIEARDPYTSGHSRRVAAYSRVIARAIGLTSHQVERISIAALLHDVGKIHEIYAPILRKPGKLTPEEWAIMKTHPVKSAELVATVSSLKDILGAVRHHHESWDGTGYPDGLRGPDIPLGARIIKFADTIDAMTSDRPYRNALGEREVRAELLKFRAIQFDPAICDRLLASPDFSLLFGIERSKKRTPPSNEALPVRARLHRVPA